MKRSWRSPRRAQSRIMAPEYHLIVTEGESTEPNYFAEIKQIINSRYNQRIQLRIEGEGKNTLSLFDRAVRLANNDPNPIKHVWIVFDKDSFSDDHFNQTAEYCRIASGDGSGIQYHALWSNESFELWFVLHFKYQQSGLTRKQYCLKLNSLLQENALGTYSKTRNDMYATLRSRMDAAIRNATKLMKANEGKAPAKSNPGTTVFNIIEYLRAYL